MDDVKIEIGYALPKETWVAVASNLEEVGKLIAMWFLKENFEGRGEEDAEAWLADVALACTALRYVAEFAVDKCRMIPVPDPRPGKEKENGGIH